MFYGYRWAKFLDWILGFSVWPCHRPWILKPIINNEVWAHFTSNNGPKSIMGCPLRQLEPKGLVLVIRYHILYLSRWMAINLQQLVRETMVKGLVPMYWILFISQLFDLIEKKNHLFFFSQSTQASFRHSFLSQICFSQCFLWKRWLPFQIRWFIFHLVIFLLDFVFWSALSCPFGCEKSQENKHSLNTVKIELDAVTF